MNDIVLEITAIADDGRGIARQDGKVFFVERALPGQTVRARVTREKQRYAQAERLEILRDRPDMVPPLCPGAEDCGGCPLQTVPMEQQLIWKRAAVRDALHRIAHMPDAEVNPVIPSPRQTGFRNKMEFAFGEQEGTPVLGQRRSNSRDVLNITECALMPAPAMQILDAIRDGARSSGLPAYVLMQGPRGRQTAECGGQERQTEQQCEFIQQPQQPGPKPGRMKRQSPGRQPEARGRGFWRFAVLRCGFGRHGEPGWWVQLITGKAGPEEQRRVGILAENLLSGIPEILGIVHEIRFQHDTLARGEKRAAVFGPEGATLRQTLGGLTFRLDTGSFFQVNTGAAELLCRTVRQAAGIPGPQEKVIWDLYCGVGAPGLLLASVASELIGIEYDKTAVRMAARNARDAGFSRCRYLSGDAGAVLARLSGKLPKPDIVLLDPPRAGASPDVIASVAAAAPGKIIAVSCNPATLARDTALFAAGGYALESVQPVDLFPHTMHVETVAVLTKK